jgi:uncharacterized damage-inducible protein DinB
MQPDQALFLLHGAIASLHTEHPLTRNVIAAIPPDQGDYRPDAVAKSALELAWHIVATERRFLDAVVAGQFDFSPAPRPESIKNSADLIDWYGPMFAEKTAPLAHLTGEHLVKPVDFRGLFQLPAVAYLQFILNHTVHHRGQLSMYLRPMGAKVPAIYGESYDSALAKKA